MKAAMKCYISILFNLCWEVQGKAPAVTRTPPLQRGHFLSYHLLQAVFHTQLWLNDVRHCQEERRVWQGVKNQRDSGVVISSQSINTRVYCRVVWRGSQNRLHTFALEKASRMSVAESGKTSAPSLLSGILLETEMIFAWGSFISHERLNLKKLNIHFERKLM